MSELKHVVTEQQGVSIHREISAKRPSAEFDVSQMSVQTRAAFKRVCSDGGATPEDYRHVFESILGRRLIGEILN